MLSFIKYWKRELLILSIGLLSIILFEAFQQYYYIVQFNLAEPSDFSLFGIIRNHLSRWMFWIIYSIPFVSYLKNTRNAKRHYIERLGKKILFVLFLMVLTLSSITVFHHFTLNLKTGIYQWDTFFQSLLFFTFQKGPIFFIAYLGLMVIVELYFEKSEIKLQLMQLSAIKPTHQSIYNHLRSQSIEDSSPVIEVKTGNRIKFVPLGNIIWIEADDYCVKLHEKDKFHSLRISLKQLEKELPNEYFIRVHRKSIIALNHLMELHTKDGYKIIMDNGAEISVAKSRIKNLKLNISENMAFN